MYFCALKSFEMDEVVTEVASGKRSRRWPHYEVLTTNCSQGQHHVFFFLDDLFDMQQWEQHQIVIHYSYFLGTIVRFVVCACWIRRPWFCVWCEVRSEQHGRFKKSRGPSDIRALLDEWTQFISFANELYFHQICSHYWHFPGTIFHFNLCDVEIEHVGRRKVGQRLFASWMKVPTWWTHVQ